MVLDSGVAWLPIKLGVGCLCVCVCVCVCVLHPDNALTAEKYEIRDNNSKPTFCDGAPVPLLGHGID